MTAEAGKMDPVIGRDDEIDRVVCILCRRTKNSAMLVGAPGVGKTAIAEGLAQRIAAGAVPAPLVGARVVEVDLGAMVAGTQYRGMFEERMKKVIQQAEAANGKVVLFIDEVHMLLGAGQTKGGSMDGANLLKPALARGRIRCIGATTFDEHRKYVEKDAAFERRFQKVHVQEPSVLATIDILQGLKKKYEEHHGAAIQDAAIVAAAQLANRYITGILSSTTCFPTTEFGILLIRKQNLAYLCLCFSIKLTNHKQNFKMQHNGQPTKRISIYKHNCIFKFYITCLPTIWN
jgi:ATP-dependent Clp protease ATP-binding subunit ClpA